MKRAFLKILLVIMPVLAFAQQEKESPFYASLDVASKYMWRGTVCGDAPSVHPMVGFNKGGFDVYVWGAYTLDDTYREVDVGVSYSFSNFTVELVDYFYPWKGSDFFNFSNSSTTHCAEAIVSYEPEALPLYFKIGSMIYGDDKKENGDNAFSTYGEIGYLQSFKEKNIVTVAVGASLNKGFYTDYEKKFSVVNLTAGYTRIFNLWNFELPVSASYAYNPYLDKSNFWISFSLGI